MGKQWKKAGKEQAAAKKGVLFMRITRAIQAAVRAGGTNPEANYRLKTALALAKSHSLPKDTIERAMQKGPSSQEQEVIYEGFGPHGVALIVGCLTDNPTRTVSEIRFLFKKNGGSLGGKGSVAWMFDRGPDGAYMAKTALALQDAEKLQQIKNFLQVLEDNPDCQKVYSNYKGS